MVGITTVTCQVSELEPWVQVGAAGVISGFPVTDMLNNDAVSSLYSAL